MDTNVIDDDPSVFAIIAILGAFLSLPLVFVAFITTCIAYSRTREWQKEKARQSAPSSESETLMKEANEDSESDLDPEDSGDEAELRIREEKRRDMTLTAKQYFWKEMGKTWKGTNGKDVQKAKEREDRRKLAKAVAKELVKMERRRNRKIDGESRANMAGLPSYIRAVGGEKA